MTGGIWNGVVGPYVHVSAMNQTKWWYAKRFLHPDIVSEYAFIFLWDEDLGIEKFNVGRYLSIIRKEGLEISQPGPCKQWRRKQIKNITDKMSDHFKNKIGRAYMRFEDGQLLDLFFILASHFILKASFVMA
ncbi:hypothetical protein ABKV19_023163 [Rosa sericea]